MALVTNTRAKALQDELNAINAEAAELVQDPSWRNEMAKEIGQEILEGFNSTNFIDLFTTVERLERTGRSTVREVRGMQAFHVARGGYIEESTLHAEVTEIERDQIGFHVVEHLDRLETNFAMTANDLITLGSRRLDAEINRRVLKTFQAAVPDNTSDYYIGSSGVTLGVINQAIAEVEDATEDEETPVVFGRSTMLRKVVDALTVNNAYTAFTPETNEDLLRRGVLGTYRGITFAKVKNFLDENKRPFFPANELWFVGRDAGKTAFFGAPRVKNFIEDDADYWHYIYRQDYGTTVVRPDRTRRLVDTSAAA